MAENVGPRWGTEAEEEKTLGGFKNQRVPFITALVTTAKVWKQP